MESVSINAGLGILSQEDVSKSSADKSLCTYDFKYMYQSDSGVKNDVMLELK